MKKHIRNPYKIYTKFRIKVRKPVYITLYKHGRTRGLPLKFSPIFSGAKHGVPRN